MSQVSENLKSVHLKLQKKIHLHERNSDDVKIVAVSKRQPDVKIKQALESGHRLFGENRVQEATEHWAGYRDQYDDLKLHLIGPLQTNKVKEAVALFDVIETLDREKLAIALSKEMKKQGRTLPCFIQVNTGNEPQKAGIAPNELDSFIQFCREQDLNIVGLMCIPPVNEPPALHFAFLKKLADQYSLKEISMGMSADWDKAVAIGATYVRIGTGIFGAREQ
ncbi:MAG: YggS family pyridoxal phosphate-dependent enzyme [Alphaproteobacteria bacterium]|nr:YggS family pyridoxal phosphate-dependent enzyme [Alphaproteobacteria bacterium]